MPAPQKFGAELKIDPVPQQFRKEVPIDSIPNDAPAPAPTPHVTQFERQRNAPPQTVETFLRSAVEPIAGTVSGLYRGVTQGPQNPEEAKAKNNTGKLGLLMKRMVVDPAKEQMAKAQTAKTPSESIGHSIAAAIPIVGPWAAQYAEEVGTKVGKGDIAGALGTTAGNAAMVLAPKAFKEAKAHIPTTAHAGQVLNSVELVAKDVPLTVNDTSLALNEYLKHVDAGGSKPSVITKLEDRLYNSQAPFTYEEARRFYSNISRLSDEELSSLNPNMRRLMGGIKTALGKDVTNAADVVQQKVNHLKGMKEYNKAAKLESALAEMKKWAIRAAGAAALGGAFEGARHAAGVAGALTPK